MRSERVLFSLGVIVVGVIGLTSCGVPDQEEIVGTWVPTDDTPDFVDLPFTAVADTLFLVEKPRLVFRMDGTFIAEYFPIVYTFHQELPGIVRGSGTWNVGRVPGSGLPTVTMKFKEINGKQINMWFPIKISDKLNDLNFDDMKLFFYIGDPDSGKRFSFRKLRAEEDH